MKVQLESTTKIVTLNSVPARIWVGETESGVKVHAFITRIAVESSQDCSQFERELEEHLPPAEVIEAIPLHLIL